MLGNRLTIVMGLRIGINDMPESISTKDELRQRILPILLYCQANKGDLSLWRTWEKQEDADKKLFYAYYSGLFSRILIKLEETVISRSFFRDCDLLLDKYNWYNIQNKDLELCYADGPNGCEVPDAFDYIQGLDDIIWKVSGWGNSPRCSSSWTFADVRGTIFAKRRIEKKYEDESKDSNIMNSVIVDYTPRYDSFGWMGELHVEYNISTDEFQYRNGDMGRWNLSQKDIDRIKAFLSNENNLRDFFDDKKAYSTKEAIKTEHFRAYTLHFNWNGREKTISVGIGTDIPFKHPF